MTDFYNSIRESRHIRAAVLASIFTCVLFLARALAFELRFDFKVPQDMWPAFFVGCSWKIPLKLLFLLIFGQMYGILRYFSVPDFAKIVAAMTFATLANVMVRAFAPYFGRIQVDPYGVILLDFVLAVGGLCLVRLSIRSYWENVLAKNRKANSSGLAFWALEMWGLSSSAICSTEDV